MYDVVGEQEFIFMLKGELSLLPIVPFFYFMDTSINQFKWTDELVKEYARSFGYAGEPCINEFKEKNTPKKEEPLPIKVINILDGINTDNPPFGKYYTLIINQPIPKEKYEPIKKAIENILQYEKAMVIPFINGSGWRIDMDLLQNVDLTHSNYFTKDELLEAQRKAFEAARELIFASHYQVEKYISFESYIKSLNKP